MLIQRIQGTKEKEQGIYYEFDINSNPIGVGGMGRVYLGSMISEETGKKTPVAIKVMYEDLPEDIIERARRESSIQIKHENLVEMMGFVEKNNINSISGNIHYHVISEYINGISLNDLLQGMTKNQFGIELESAKKFIDEYNTDRFKVSIRIIGQILSAIMTLHDNGYIHRDIDPSNIMLTSKGTIKLIDFGIAKRLTTLASQDKMLTSSGIFMGKAQYAAPELVTGDIKHQNASTDIYSIGILFYQLLTGTLPFDGPISEILEAQLHKKVNVKNIDNKDCRAIVKKATEKKQNERYISAAEFRVAIDNVKVSKSNLVKRKDYSTPIHKWKKFALAISAMVIVAVVTILYMSNKGDDNPPPVVNVTTAIDYDIAAIFGIDSFEYDSLIDLAFRYYSDKDIGEMGKNYGKELMISNKGTSIFKDTEYDNIKVAYILYDELRNIATKNNDRSLLDTSNKYLNRIKETSILYIEE